MMDTSNFDYIQPRDIDDPSHAIFTGTEVEQRRKASADKLLEVLLTGAVINRKTCHHYGIGEFNCSLHSLVSDLVHRRSIPVARRYDEKNMAWYSITDQDRDDYFDPERRKVQAERVRRESTSSRIHSSLARALRTIRGALEFPELFERYPFAIEGIRRIHHESGRVIKKEGRAAKVPAANQDMFDSTHSGEVEHG